MAYPGDIVNFAGARGFECNGRYGICSKGDGGLILCLFETTPLGRTKILLLSHSGVICRTYVYDLPQPSWRGIDIFTRYHDTV